MLIQNIKESTYNDAPLHKLKTYIIKAGYQTEMKSGNIFNYTG